MEGKTIPLYFPVDTGHLSHFEARPFTPESRNTCPAPSRYKQWLKSL